MPGPAGHHTHILQQEQAMKKVTRGPVAFLLFKCGRPQPVTGWGLDLNGCPAVTYSPTPSRVQYHRRCGS